MQDDKEAAREVAEPKKRGNEAQSKAARIVYLQPKEHHVRSFALVFFCFIASFFGSWVFLASGLVSLDNTNIGNNKETVVMQEGEVVADIAKRVGPSVVSIAAEGSANRFGLTQESSGTGVIISKDGYILTNKHVVSEATRSVDVQLSDGTSYENVAVVGRDPLNDLAFLKINGVNDLTPAKIGDSSSMKVGQKVIAIGNALGEFQNSVTTGIISGIGRPLSASSEGGQDMEQLEGLLQTDAAINPGNSGGPLLNLNGEVIGINTAIADEAEGIGFAIPINTAKGLIETVTKTGKVERAYLGVQYISLTPDVAKALNVARKSGAYIYVENGNAVVSGSPAASAGIKNRDIIIKVNGTDISEKNGLSALVSQYTPGTKITLTIVRDGKEQKIDITLGTYQQ